MKIAQLSDLHLTSDGVPLYGEVDTEAALLKALTRAAAFSPDLLLLTGDLAEGGETSAYHRLRGYLERFGAPYLLLPGNHDRREALREVFPDQGWEGRADGLCCHRVDMGEGTLLLLDVTVPGKEYGDFGAAQRAWLDAYCPADRPVLLAQHHPPFAVGIPFMDAIRCRGEAEEAAWLERHPSVEVLLCGHIHRYVTTGFAGRPAFVAPSPAHQIALEPGPLAYTLEPGGFLLHTWMPGQRWLTHHLTVEPPVLHVYA